MPTLNWIGEEVGVNHHQQAPFHLFKEAADLSCGGPGNGNLIVQGDNLSWESLEETSEEASQLLKIEN